MKRLFYVLKSLLLSTVWLGLCLPVETLAGEIYSYVDRNGVLNLTDIPPKFGDTHVKVYKKSSLQDTKRSTTKMYKCVIKKRVYYADHAKNSCYKLIYQNGDSISSFAVPLDSGSPPPIPVHRKYDDYKTLIQDVATSTRLEPALLHAVIQTESAYNPKAVSPKGAVGLMQLMPATARRFGVKNRRDATANVYGGARYLRYLLKLFNNNLKLALAGYNAGENAVKRYGNKIPPYRETKNYVKKVMRLYKAHKGR
jgi:hypothetical protein